MLMAIDYGSRRIGIAVSESGILATPHSVIRNEGDAVAKLAHLAARLEADTIILGIPKRPKSDAHEKRFRDLAESLRQKTCKQVVLWDETLTTAVAAEKLREAGRSRRDTKDIDMHAAAVILQSYLDAHRARRPS